MGNEKLLRKYLVWAIVPALVNIAIVAVRPMYWLGSIGFIWIMFWLALSVGVLATYAWVYSNSKSEVKSVLAILLFFALIVGIVVAGYLLKIQQPELTAGEVKSIINLRTEKWSTRLRVVSTEYKGGGIWRVRVISASGLSYWNYNEDTNSLGEDKGTPTIQQNPTGIPPAGYTPSEEYDPKKTKELINKALGIK